MQRKQEPKPPVSAHSLSIPARFFDVFIKGVVGTMREALLEALLLAGALIYDLVRFGTSLPILLEHVWEVITPWVCALSIIIVFHSIRSAIRLVRMMTIEAAQPAAGTILNPRGGTFPSGRTILPRLYFIKIWTTAATISAFAMVCSVLLILNTIKGHESQLEQNNVGILRPANLPSPHTNCQLVPGALNFVLGGGVLIARILPYTVIQMAGESLLAVDRIRQEPPGISLTFQLFDDKGEIVANETADNKFWINPLCRFERPDQSTLRVFDRRNKLVLNVAFVNRDVVWVSGIFRYPTRTNIVVVPASDTPTKEELPLERYYNLISGNCNYGQYAVGIKVN